MKIYDKVTIYSFSKHFVLPIRRCARYRCTGKQEPPPLRNRKPKGSQTRDVATGAGSRVCPRVGGTSRPWTWVPCGPAAGLLGPVAVVLLRLPALMTLRPLSLCDVIRAGHGASLPPTQQSWEPHSHFRELAWELEGLGQHSDKLQMTQDTFLPWSLVPNTRLPCCPLHPEAHSAPCLPPMASLPVASLPVASPTVASPWPPPSVASLPVASLPWPPSPWPPSCGLTSTWLLPHGLPHVA